MTASAPLRTAAALLLAAAGFIVALAGPALAHGRGADATNYRAEITTAPDLPGLTWTIYGGDELLSLRVEGEQTVEVPGYEGEPYLRFTPDAVWRNLRSPATYLNEERFAQVALPADVDPRAEPDWEQVASDGFYAWHDHNIHWMSPNLPDVVGDGTERTLVQEREIAFSVDGEPYALSVALWWEPPPSPWPWLAIGLALSVSALAGLGTGPRDEPPDARGGRWPGLTRPAAVILAVVSLAGVARVIDDVAAMPLPTTTAVFAAAQTLLFTAVGLFGAWRAWRGAYGDVIALAFGAAAVMFGQGLVLWSVLVSSQLATVFPEWFSRIVVATSIAQGPILGVVAVVGYRRLVTTLPEPEPAAAP